MGSHFLQNETYGKAWIHLWCCLRVKQHKSIVELREEVSLVKSHLFLQSFDSSGMLSFHPPRSTKRQNHSRLYSLSGKPCGYSYQSSDTSEAWTLCSAIMFVLKHQSLLSPSSLASLKSLSCANIHENANFHCSPSSSTSPRPPHLSSGHNREFKLPKPLQFLSMHEHTWHTFFSNSHSQFVYSWLYLSKSVKGAKG